MEKNNGFEFGIARQPVWIPTVVAGIQTVPCAVRKKASMLYEDAFGFSGRSHSSGDSVQLIKTHRAEFGAADPDVPH